MVITSVGATGHRTGVCHNNNNTTNLQTIMWSASFLYDTGAGRTLWCLRTSRNVQLMREAPNSLSRLCVRHPRSVLLRVERCCTLSKIILSHTVLTFTSRIKLQIFAAQNRCQHSTGCVNRKKNTKREKNARWRCLYGIYKAGTFNIKLALST